MLGRGENAYKVNLRQGSARDRRAINAKRPDRISRIGASPLRAIGDQAGWSEKDASSSSATSARNSLEGLKTGTGRAETSTGEPVRGFLAMRVLRWRILKVPKPRTSMFFCSFSASLMASRKASTTRAQSFFEIIGPAVFAIWAVTCSTRSALVIRNLGLAIAEWPIVRRKYDVNRCVSSVWLVRGAAGADGLQELAEERPRVVRARGGLRMVLDREDRELPMHEPLHRSVVQVHVRHPEGRRAGYSLLIPHHGKPVILGRDQHPIGVDLADGVISPPVSVRHLHGSCAEREAEELMPEANSQNRDLLLRQGANDPRRVVDGGRVSWT